MTRPTTLRLRSFAALRVDRVHQVSIADQRDFEFRRVFRQSNNMIHALFSGETSNEHHITPLVEMGRSGLRVYEVRDYPSPDTHLFVSRGEKPRNRDPRSYNMAVHGSAHRNSARIQEPIVPPSLGAVPQASI